MMRLHENPLPPKREGLAIQQRKWYATIARMIRQASGSMTSPNASQPATSRKVFIGPPIRVSERDVRVGHGLGHVGMGPVDGFGERQQVAVPERGRRVPVPVAALVEPRHGDVVAGALLGVVEPHA